MGDWVLVRLQPYRQTSLSYRLHHKLAARYFGPVQVSHGISSVAYEVDLPEVVISNKVASLPMAVLGSRVLLKGEKQQVEVLIQWEGAHLEEASWEDLEEMCAIFPSLDLAGKVSPNEDGVEKQLLP